MARAFVAVSGTGLSPAMYAIIFGSLTAAQMSRLSRCTNSLRVFSDSPWMVGKPSAGMGVRFISSGGASSKARGGVGEPAMVWSEVSSMGFIRPVFSVGLGVGSI